MASVAAVFGKRMVEDMDEDERAEELDQRQQRWVSAIVDGVNVREQLEAAQKLTVTRDATLLERLHELEDELKAADERTNQATEELEILQSTLFQPSHGRESAPPESRMDLHWRSADRQRHAAQMWLERKRRKKAENQERLINEKAKAAAAALEEEAAAGVPSLAAVNGCRRFVHPMTGFEMPAEVHFAPRSCILIDNNRASCPPRGLLYYLATGGGQLAGQTKSGIEYINPGNREAWLAAIDQSIADVHAKMEKEDAETLEMLPVLWDLEAKIPHTRLEIEEMAAQARQGLKSITSMEEYLTSVSSLSDPMPGRIDEIRRAICGQRTQVDETLKQARESQALLERRRTLRSALKHLTEQAPLNAAELERLEANRNFIAEYGVVTVTSSGWQQGEEWDVLSYSPTFSWSDYYWEEESSPHHPQRRPAGPWFQIELPEGLSLMPTHYALRHGDDGCYTTPGLRHDANCSMFSVPGMAPPGLGQPPTSWGCTTRAKRAFAGTALLHWQLWARRSSQPRDKWVLLKDHIDDRSLHGAFQAHVWAVPWEEGREFRIFRVIMTGPSSNGAHALMCSGFELFGKVGTEAPPPPKPEPPRNLAYQFPFELYIVDGRAITPNMCSLESGTNTDGCKIVYICDPLPPGLICDRDTGTISGAVDWANLTEEFRSPVLRGAKMTFHVTAKNSVGKASTKVCMVLLRAPEQLELRHSHVTYEVKKMLRIVRAWYGGPHEHSGEIDLSEVSDKTSWLWQCGEEKGKEVTDVVQSYMEEGALLFNQARRPCSDVFGFGHDWDCWKVLVIEYRYGGGGLKTWISASEQDENYSCVLGASEGGRSAGDGRIVFSKEMLEKAAADGWRPPEFGPIKIDRTVDNNGPTRDFFDPGQRALQPTIGSRFEWPQDKTDLPSVGGVEADIRGRWPLFHVTPDLPRGLELDPYTGLISGKPEVEADGSWLFTVSNPAGATSRSLRMRIMSPPHDLEYEHDEKVLIRGEEAGVNSCFVSGSRPMRFKPDSLPKGLIMYEDGTIRGVPDQLDIDFERYIMRAANDVGECSCEIKLLVSMPPSTEAHTTDICLINKDCEARAGQRVRATAEYILRRSHLGLGDHSATEARDAFDCQRSGKLQLQSWELAGQRRGNLPAYGGRLGLECTEAGALHETAAGRGTVIHVLDDGNVCQVRWDATGLVDTYNTGRHGEYSLQTWGTESQLRKHWEALPEEQRETLHDELGEVLDDFLSEYNALTPLQRPGAQRLAKSKLYSAANKHTHEVYHVAASDESLAGLASQRNLDHYLLLQMNRHVLPASFDTRTPLPLGTRLHIPEFGPEGHLCPRGSGLLQRLIRELDLGWLAAGAVGNGFKDPSLFMALQIPDRKVSMIIDWVRHTSS